MIAVEIPVEPISNTTYQPGEIPTHSALYRADTQLNTVLDIALRSRAETDQARPLTVLSVGSSFGAEADTALDYIGRVAPNVGRVSVIGVDVNPRAVEQARQAKYVAQAPLVDSPQGKVHLDLGEHLTAFQVTPNPDRKGEYLVDSSALRAKHDVSFVEADLADNNEDIPQADVILCNNLLFHLDEQAAERLVRAMARHLAVGGVMSFGANAKQVRMSGNRDDTNYPEWRRRIAEKLEEEGIEPVFYDVARKAPFVFRRVRPSAA